ncbi:proton-coupled amino acid transporter-like protein CG1139 isoform X1 [Diorhabda carinulata]|uniref:proton-coupled amino acid transporter-like protein CG1139 isoform X1 n=2 Tax=Diorhabda carinulata TaxID=1163345 RepID=UPI0025A261A5|nr:proton-coupled amino acid transporter-like protein CG1139 isoform X1 [Diorhabda carinulata]XP_057662151.1 proton-coupled amino acid transporter-like protein CG1139 isoform X1 [Diorhabda carinulata]XP_057662152.1 proton-coupled amino acid transporter-like protein CG1139 isoform X1 [Diorhabda carinulata]
MVSDTVKLEPLGSPTDEKARKIENDEEYFDPHLHRHSPHPTTNMETLIHLLKAAIGTGILAMPEAFKFAGMVNGIISTILIGLLCTYTLHVLIRSQYEMCKRRKVGLLTYPESMRVACEMGPNFLRGFAPYAPALTNFFLIFYQIGICCVYIVFVGVNVKAVADQYIKPEISLILYTLMFFIPFLLTMMVRNLKLLSPFSYAANFITLLTFGVCGYYVFQNLPPFSSLPAFGPWASYPLYFGTCLFSLQACGVVIALENNMEHPKSFLKPLGVLNIGMLIVTLIYVLLAMMGYWRYGEHILPSITLNFPSVDPLAQVIRILYSTAILISYGLQGYPAVQIILTNYILPYLKSSTTEKRKLVYEYLLRFAIVALTFILGITVPLLGLFISLVGAFCLSALGIAFPAIIEIAAYWPDRLGRGRWILWKDIALIIIGVVGLVAGSYSCIYEIVKALAAGKS